MAQRKKRAIPDTSLLYMKRDPVTGNENFRNVQAS
jgi:hypothetical protein